MYKHAIYCIDEHYATELYYQKLKNNFESIFVNSNNNFHDALNSIKVIIDDGYEIPVIIVSQTIFKANQNFFYSYFSANLCKSKLIVLMDDFQIENFTCNTYDFLHFLPKSWADLELILTVREFIKSYWQNIQLEYSLNTDSLTGLYNRNILEKQLNNNTNYGLLLFNIDDFRLINSSYGYKVGDILLKKFADFLLSHFARKYTYRLISNEFVVLLEPNEKEHGLIIAENIKNSLNNTLFQIENKNIFLTLCIAVANEGTDLIERAQNTIYQGRQNSKNRIFIADSPCTIDETIPFNKIQQALEDDNLIPYFQGIHNNKTNKIEKYECLARLKIGNAIISPKYFLEEAKKTGLITKITRRIIEKSFHFFSNTSYSFSINITEEDLEEDYLVAYVKEMSIKYSIDYHRIMFEILESMNIENNHSLILQIKQLKELGCLIAFDDFGCEKSNFSRMLSLNIDVIKIDSMFIKNIHNDEKSYKLTKAITNMAKDMGCKVVAECIECEEAQKIINTLDIDYTQGYLFSTPSSSIEQPNI